MHRQSFQPDAQGNAPSHRLTTHFAELDRQKRQEEAQSAPKGEPAETLADHLVIIRHGVQQLTRSQGREDAGQIERELSMLDPASTDYASRVAALSKRVSNAVLEWTAD